MPGIVGIFSADELSSDGAQSFSAMADSLKHTATQKLSRYRYENLILSRVDLGIFQTNIEPRETDDLIVFIWGELINPQAERKALLHERCNRDEKIDDLDFLIGLFCRSKKDQDFASSLRGSFNAFIVEKRRRTLRILNDRFGFRPLYYYLSGSEVVFSSEVKGILKYKKIKKVVNPAGLADFFHFGFVTDEKTFFDRVEMFPAGGTAIFENRNLQIERYWNLTFTNKEKEVGNVEVYHIDKLAAAIQESVKANTEGGFRFGLPLSGGLDSRTIAACIPKDRYPVPIYTWGMPNSLEVRIARKVAETLCLEHRNLHRTPEDFVANFEKSVIMTDGMISANLPLVNFLYERSFAPRVDICLDGMQSICVVHPVGSAANFLDQIAASPPADALKCVLTDSYYGKFKALAESTRKKMVESVSTLHPINGYQFLDITQKQRRLDNFGILVKRNFVEVRSPLFDYPVMDVIQSIPASLRQQRYVYHKAFTQISPELAEIKNVATMVSIRSPHWLQMAGRVTKGLKYRIYSALYQRAGIGYDPHKLSDWGIDYSRWYSESAAVKNFMNMVLCRENLKTCEHLNPEGVAQILEEHLAGRKNYADTINRLMTYTLWSKNFL